MNDPSQDEALKQEIARRSYVRFCDRGCAQPPNRHVELAECSEEHRRLATACRMLSETADAVLQRRPQMDMIKKAVVELPKSTAPPVKAPPQHEHHHEAAKPSGSQAKPKA
jgi:hypothetical protein